MLQRTMEGVARALHRFIGEDYEALPGGTEVKMEGQNTTHLVSAELPPVVAKSVASVAAAVEAQIASVMSVTPVQAPASTPPAGSA